MINFRSPWLSHLPQIEVSGRLARQSARLIFFGIVGFILLLLLLLIWQPTARSGPVYLLYWVHDRLFLPIKAYTYTIFFPTSIIWWGVTATVFSLWLISYLSDRSLILQPHIWLLRFAVHQPGLHPTLVGFARQFKPYGIEPALLKTIAEQERALACQHVGKTVEARVDPVAHQSAVRFTTLLVQLYCSPGGRLTDHLYAAVLWYETLLLLLIFAETSASEQENAKAFLLAELAACAGVIGDQLPKQHNPLADDRTESSPFAPEALTNDFYLTCYSQPAIADAFFGTDQTLRLDQEKIGGQLAQAVAKRRRLLEQQRHATVIDKRRNGIPVAPGAVGVALASQQSLTAQELALCGRLSFGIALYTAYVSGTPALAVSYLDAVETLSFTLAFAADAHPSDQPTHQYLRALVAETPTVIDYRLCAALQTNQLHTRRQAWANSPLDDAELIVAADFDLAATHIATIMHASGPPPTAEAYVSHERAWVRQALVQLQRLGPAYTVLQKYTPIYTARVGKGLSTYTHVLTEQAEAFYERYGRTDQVANATKTMRQLADDGLETLKQQRQWLLRIDSLEKFKRRVQVFLNSDHLEKLKRQCQALLTKDQLEKLRRQGQALYAETITSGRASAFLLEQWRQLKAFITSIRIRWRW